MTQQWRVRLYGVPRKQPDIQELTRLVLLLARELQHQSAEADASLKAVLPEHDQSHPAKGAAA